MDACALPEVTTTVMLDSAPAIGVMVLLAAPADVNALIGFAVPSATTLNVTCVPSATLLPLESVTVAVTVDELDPSQTINAGLAVSAIEAGLPTSACSLLP